MDGTSPTEEYTSANSSPDHLSYKSCQSPNVTSASDASLKQIPSVPSSSSSTPKQLSASQRESPHGQETTPTLSPTSFVIQSSGLQQQQQPEQKVNKATLASQPPNTLPVSRSESFSSESIYELVRSPFSDQHPAASHVVSERVQTLASQIYNELQLIMSRLSNDDEAVSGLMPLIVNVLESLDLSIIENQQLQVELELCKDDNEQLVSAFEKEKTGKKKIEQRLLELELQNEEDKQQLSQKVESVESIMRILELKAKNSADHSSRLEEKEIEMKSEYNKLHTRYTELLRSHCDLMERVKILISNEDFSSANNTSGPPSLAASAAIRNFLTKKLEMDEALETEQKDEQARAREAGLLASPEASRPAWDTEMSLEDASIIEDVDDIPRDQQNSLTHQSTRDTSDREKERERDLNSLNGKPLFHFLLHASLQSHALSGDLSLLHLFLALLQALRDISPALLCLPIFFYSAQNKLHLLIRFFSDSTVSLSFLLASKYSRTRHNCNSALSVFLSLVLTLSSAFITSVSSNGSPPHPRASTPASSCAIAATGKVVALFFFRFAFLFLASH